VGVGAGGVGVGGGCVGGTAVIVAAGVVAWGKAVALAVAVVVGVVGPEVGVVAVGVVAAGVVAVGVVVSGAGMLNVETTVGKLSPPRILSNTRQPLKTSTHTVRMATNNNLRFIRLPRSTCYIRACPGLVVAANLHEWSWMASLFYLVQVNGKSNLEAGD
jgi:hypothetical protein